MSAEQLTDSLDVWTSAIKTNAAQGRGNSKKRDLHGIKKLRELILELAVRGKLVPQNPQDEPASQLLERVADEKSRLIKNKTIKKPKKLDDIVEEELLFTVPLGWRWGRLQDVTIYIQRGLGPEYDEQGVVRVVSQKCIQWSGFDLEPSRYITNESLKKYSIERFLQKNDLLLNSTGTGTVGRIVELDYTPTKNLVADSHVTVIRPIEVIGGFLKIYVSAPGIQTRFDPSHETALVSGSTKQVELNTSTVEALLIPIPPKEEQARIVAKVEELMNLCDQLELKTQASADAQKLLTEALLGSLTTARSASELSENWTRLNNHFDELITTDYAVEQLKQTILRLAVMGKLVNQDPTDEPATIFLEKITDERLRLVNENKIKKQPVIPAISDEELPFDIPKGWRFCRLEDICYGITSGSTPPKSEFQETNGVPYLKVYNIRNQSIDFNYSPQYVTHAYHSTKLKRSILYPGDVVMNIVGPPLGKVAIVPSTHPEWNCNQAITFFRPINPKLSRYIYTYLKAGIFLNKIELIGTAGQDNISITKSRSIVLPTPPLDEQTRIIAKVDELMLFCDQLSDHIKKAQNTQLKLTDAVVYKIIGEPGKNADITQVDAQPMKITTTLNLDQVTFGSDAIISSILLEAGRSADAKEVWRKTKLSLPEFYAQLKKEIEAKYIIKPERAIFEGIEN